MRHTTHEAAWLNIQHHPQRTLWMRTVQRTTWQMIRSFVSIHDRHYLQLKYNERRNVM